MKSYRLPLLFGLAILLAFASIFKLNGLHGFVGGMEHEGMDMVCEDRICENSAVQKNCLEHCLQVAASESAPLISAQSSDDQRFVAVQPEIFERPARKIAFSSVQSTGPPHTILWQLTIQKKE